MLWTVYLAIFGFVLSTSAERVQVPFTEYVHNTWAVRVIGPRYKHKDPVYLSHYYTLHENNTLIGTSGASTGYLPDMLQSRSGWWGGRAVFKDSPIVTDWLLLNSTQEIGDLEQAPVWATDYARWLWQVTFSDNLGLNGKVNKKTTVSRLLLAYYVVRGPEAEVLPSMQLDQPVDLPPYNGFPDSSDSHILIHFAADAEIPFLLA